MDRKAKEEAVASFRELFAAGETVIVTHYAGLDAAAVTDLRRRMREAGAGFRVTKNRLVRRALEGTPHEGLAALFEGPTAIAYAPDPVSPAKVLAGFARENESLVILGGGLGDQALDAAEVRRYATLPSLEELRGRILAMITTPARRIAVVAQGTAGGLARLLRAYAETKETTAS